MLVGVRGPSPVEDEMQALEQRTQLEIRSLSNKQLWRQL